MPRVVNAALALFLLAFLAPAVSKAGGLPLWVQVVLALLAVGALVLLATAALVATPTPMDDAMAGATDVPAVHAAADTR